MRNLRSLDSGYRGPALALRLLLLLVAVLAMVVGVPTQVALAEEPPPPPPATQSQSLQQAKWGTTDLGRLIQAYRANHPEVSAASNVAVFEYTLPNGTRGAVAVASSGSTAEAAVFDTYENGKYVGSETVTDFPERQWRTGSTATGVANLHSEELVFLKLLRDANGHPDLLNLVTRGESEREPCQSGSQCAMHIGGDWFSKIETMTYNVPYGGNPDENEKANDELQRSIEQWNRDGNVPMRVNLIGDLPGALSGGNSTPGGIDFSSLELRYVSDAHGKGSTGPRYAFSAKVGGSSDPTAGRNEALQSLDSLFVWLELNPDKFWVNLNPAEPDRIIDPQLAKTDAGRILLESDLALKRVSIHIDRPDGPLGSQLISSPGYSAEPGCSDFRLWIVPAPATVQQDGDSLLVLDAPLDVKIDSADLRIPDRPVVTCPRAIHDNNAQTYRALILPKIRDFVNKSPEFADLRRVYLSRVVAEWYKQRNARGRANHYGELIGENDVTRWPARTTWTSQAVFDQYMNSLKNGEWTGTARGADGKTYVYTEGGVDFSNVTLTDVSPSVFRAKWGDLPAVVDGSIAQTTVDGHGGVWFGSLADAAPQSDRFGGAKFAALLVLVLTLNGVVVVIRSRRRRRNVTREG